MTGNPEAPDGGRAPEAAAPSQPGRVAEFALVAAGLGLMVYLLGFADDTALGTSLIGPLLLGGGLLAGSVVLPTVGTRVLAPAAVAVVTGALLLLQTDVSGESSPFAIAALVLALLEAGAAVGAALLHAGVLRARPPRPKREKEREKEKAVAPPQAGPPQQYGYAPLPGQQFPGQQYPGQPYPGQSYPGAYAGYPGEPYAGDHYAGEHAYAQQARYGGQYGVPGYPPPPPYGAPGYDPTVPATAGYPVRGRPDVPQAPAGASEQPTTVSGPEAYGSAATTPTPPYSSTPSAAEAPGSGAPVPGSAGAGAEGPGSGTYRPAASYTEPRSEPAVPAAPAAPETPSGSHAAPSDGAAAGRSDPAVPRGEPGAHRGDEDDWTRAIPTVTDER